MSEPAQLVLEDGSIFRGVAVGALGTTVGEVVFNTAMSGYQEILTDPSYARQIVTLTYPHIGNTGVNELDQESRGPQAAGLIIRDLPLVSNCWRQNQTLPEYLSEHGVVAIAEIDTRRLTRLLRKNGSQRGVILAGEDALSRDAQALINEFPGLAGMDLAKTVSCDKQHEWNEGSWQIEGDRYREAPAEQPYHVVAYDFGVKHNILRLLTDRGCRLTVVPAQTPASEVLAMQPDGVFLSNGPGDPEPCDYAIAAAREIIEAGVPIFGICLGHQLLGLAVGAQSVKMKTGHHGANHPVLDHRSGRVLISSQNHGFAINADTLPEDIEVTHTSLFDGTLQGLKHRSKPVLGFQGHPEASPGPHDVRELFDEFVTMLADRKVAAGAK